MHKNNNQEKALEAQPANRLPKVDPNHWTVFCRFLASEIPLGISLVPVTQA
jgi:hypothetical protein